MTEQAQPGPSTMGEFSREVFEMDGKAALELVLAENERIRMASRANAEVRVGSNGFEATNLGGIWRLAQLYWKAQLYPYGIKNIEDLVICMGHGAEIGLSPLQSVQSIAVINGKPELYGDAMLGLCRASALFDQEAFTERIEGTGDDRRAVCTVRRLPNGQIHTQSFSVKQAKTAKLWGKTGKNGHPTPWVTYEERMLQMRARSWALRDTFPDILKGLGMVEEDHDTSTEATPAEEATAALAARLEGKDERLKGLAQAASEFAETAGLVPAKPEPTDINQTAGGDTHDSQEELPLEKKGEGDE